MDRHFLKAVHLVLMKRVPSCVTLRCVTENTDLSSSFSDKPDLYQGLPYRETLAPFFPIAMARKIMLFLKFLTNGAL